MFHHLRFCLPGGILLRCCCLPHLHLFNNVGTYGRLIVDFGASARQFFHHRSGLVARYVLNLMIELDGQILFS
jgi:hypothetical protein